MREDKSAFQEAADKAVPLAQNFIMSRSVAHAYSGKFLEEFRLARIERVKRGELRFWWKFWR